VDEAVKFLHEAVRKHPDLPPAPLMMARLFLATRDGKPQGRSALERAVAEHPDHPEVYLTLGTVAMSEGRVAEALLVLQKALELSAADRWTADQKDAFQRQARAGLAAAREAREKLLKAREPVPRSVSAAARLDQLERDLGQLLREVAELRRDVAK
jgi:uncharacterized protein HemY